ncbi:MAG: SIS domain-containing protein [Chitinispirillaceae bacterium]
MKKNVKKILDECLERHSDLQTCSDSICRAFDILVECHSRGSKLLVCGNGGSAADAEHITGELMNRFMLRRPVPQSFREKLGGDECGIYLGEKLQQAFRAVSLVSQSALITAIANDLGPDLVFAQQVYGYGKAGDVLLAVSTSGNSANVLNAIRVARALQVEVIGLTGRSGGRMSSLCDVSICTPSDTTPLIQESHLVLYHTLCAMVEAELFS